MFGCFANLIIPANFYHWTAAAASKEEAAADSPATQIFEEGVASQNRFDHQERTGLSCATKDLPATEAAVAFGNILRTRRRFEQLVRARVGAKASTKAVGFEKRFCTG